MNKVKYFFDLAYHILYKYPPLFRLNPPDMLALAETGLAYSPFFVLVEDRIFDILIVFGLVFGFSFINVMIGNRYFTEEKKEEIEQKFAHIRVSRFMSILCNFALLIICDAICIFALCLTLIIYK